MTQTIAELIRTYQISVEGDNLRCRGKMTADDMAAIKANKNAIIITLKERDDAINNSLNAEASTCSHCGKKHTETIKVGLNYYCSTCYTMLNQIGLGEKTMMQDINRASIDNTPIFKKD